MRIFSKWNVSIIGFLCLISIGLNAQTNTGQILDSKTKTPVPFANIQIGEGYGVISNEEGYFSINTEKFKASDSLYISSLGYKKKGITIKEISEDAKIFLDEEIFDLQTVYLSNKQPDVYAIMEQVKLNLDKNYKPNLTQHQLFNRSTQTVNIKLLDFEIKKGTGYNRQQLKNFNIELDALEKDLKKGYSMAFTDFIGDFYRDSSHSSKLKVIKATKLIDPENDKSLKNIEKRGKQALLKHLNKEATYKVKSGLFKVDDSLSFNDSKNKKIENKKTYNIGELKNSVNNIITNHEFGEDSKLDFILEQYLYHYKLLNITYYNDELVYVISFSPKKGKAKFTGILYVNENDHAVLKIDYRFADGKRGKNINLRFLLGLQYTESGWTGAVIYKKHNSGYYFPNYIKQEDTKRVYANRPFKFKENNSKKHHVKFNFKIETEMTEKIELLFLTHSEISQNTFETFKQEDSVPYLELGAYDASVWKGYNAIEPIDAMKAFKVQD